MAEMDAPARYIRHICTWLQHAGGSLHPAVEIVHSEYPAGYSLRVRDGHHIPAGSQVVICPNSLVLSVLTIDYDSHPWRKQLELCHGPAPEILTRFSLMEEFLKGEESFWHPYIQMLPQPGEYGFDTPLYYDEGDCDWIRGTNLEAATIAREEQWRHEYLHFSCSLTSSSGHKHMLFEGKWHLYKWAATILTSRCFSSTAFAMNRACDSRDGPAIAERKGAEGLLASHVRFPILIPVFDIANHDPVANVTWSSQMECCSFTTNSNMRAGEEVCISYDNKSNEELILGYGFSLFNNAADVFGLVLRTVPAHQKFAKDKERQEKSEDEGEEPVGSSTVSEHLYEMTSNQPFQESPANHNPAMTPLTTGVYYLTSAMNTSFSVGNQQLVETLSDMLANNRERKTFATTSLGVGTQSSLKPLPHNRLRVVSTLFMELQRKLLAITAHDALLPPWPLKDRQFHAARYRRGQVQILETNIESLKRELRAAHTKKSRLVRLEDILAPSTTPPPNKLRAAVHHVLRTRDAGKIRRGGYGDLVFTLWFCSSWLLRAEGMRSDCALFQNIFNDWLDFVEKVYGPPPLETDGCGSRGNQTDLTVGSPQREIHGYEKYDGDEYAIAESYLDAVKTISERYPWWKSTEDQWTVTFLRWGLHIVQEEGLMFPGLDGEAGDEFVVFVSSEEMA